MARISKLVIYDGPEKALARQFAISMSEGIHKLGDMEITIINLGENPILDGFIQEEKDKRFTEGGS